MDKHIVNLLKTNNRVIIPEFGAFIVKSGSPRTIVFNEFLKYNDEILLKEICRAENISETEASEKLDEFTRELNSQLDLGQQHKLGLLGTLSKDPNGRVHFQMSSEMELAGESSETVPKKEEAPEKIDLNEPVQEKKDTKEVSKPVETTLEITKESKQSEESVSKEKEKEKKSEPVVNSLKKDEIKKEDIQKEKPKEVEVKKESETEKQSVQDIKASEKNSTPLTVNEKLQSKNKTTENKVAAPQKKEVQKSEKTGSNNKNVIWYTLVGVSVVAIVVWFLIANKEYIFNSDKPNKGDEVVIQPKVNDTETAESANGQGENNNENNVTLDSETELKDTETPVKEDVAEQTSEKKPIVTSNQSKDKRYYIVAGCFKQENNANDYVTYLNGQGFNSEKFGKYGGLFAVSFNSYGSYSEAQKELNKIRESTEPEAWILYY